MLLKNKVTVIVPSTVGTDAASADLVNQKIEMVLDTLARVAGGSTAENAEGAWLDSKGRLVRERVCKVYAYCTDAQKPWVIEAAERMARYIRRSMRQESVAVIVDDAMYFIDDDDAEVAAALETLEFYYDKWLELDRV